MQTENNTPTPKARKPWSQPELVLISQANIEVKFRTAAHEKTFVGSNPITPALHSLNFQHHTIIAPVAVTAGDFVS